MENIILCGFMGSGKTTVASELGRRFGYICLDTDHEIEASQGQSIREIFSSFGEEHFRRLEADYAKNLWASQKKGLVIATGGGMMAYPSSAGYLKKTGKVICLNRSLEHIYSEIAKDESRPLFFGKTFEQVRKLWDQRMQMYLRHADIVMENNASPKECAEQIGKYMHLL